MIPCLRALAGPNLFKIMNVLEKFHKRLDVSDYDATNELEINTDLLEVSKQLHKEDLIPILKLSELERQCFALRISFDVEDNKQPRGVSWQISGTEKTEDGEEVPIVWPNINQFSKTDFEYVEERYKNTSNLFAKTQFGLILYFQRPNSFSRHNDFKEQLSKELFELAKYYEKKIINASEKKYYFIHLYQAIKGALNISIASKLINLKKEITVWLQDLHKSWSLDRVESLRVLLDITQLITDNYKHLKDEVDLVSIIKKNLDGVETQAKKYTWGAIYILDSTSLLDKKGSLNFYNYTKRKAELYEQLAYEAEGTPRQLTAIKFVEKALRLYREMNDQVNITRLEARFQEIRGSGIFGIVQHKLDEENFQGKMEEVNKDVEERSSKEILQILSSLHFFPSYEIVEEASEKAYEQYLYLNHLDSSIVDKNGNTIANYHTEEEKKQLLFWQTYEIDFNYRIRWLVYYFLQAFKSDKINFRSTQQFLNESWLNESIQRNYNGKPIEIRPIEILIPPIKMLFNELKLWTEINGYEINLVVISDSLILKIEAMLRYLCERVGIATFKPRDKGIVMEKNLDEILADLKSKPESQTLLDENDRLFIKFVLSEKAGLNLRNRIAHGLMDIHEYNLNNVVAIFSIILRFCSYSFTTRK